MRTLIVASALSLAAVLAVSSGSFAAGAKNGKFCFQEAAGGASNCSYQTMNECQSAHKTGCMAQPETTGSGMNSGSSGMNKSTGGTGGSNNGQAGVAGSSGGK
jgi:hypothetical protein